MLFFTKLPPTGNFVKFGSGPFYYNCSSCSDCNSAIVDASSGDTIFLNASVAVVNNVSCVNITGKSNIIFDCLNNPINGSSGWFSGGITKGISISYLNNSIIKNCNISGFDMGIKLSYSDNNTLQNSVISGNYLEGMELYMSSYNNLTALTTNSNYWSAVGVNVTYNSINNTLTNIISNNNPTYGISIERSSNYTLLTNITSKNNRFAGIRFFSSGNNILVNSHIENNSQYGIYLSSSQNNLIYNNYFNNTADYILGDNNFNTTKTAGTNIIWKNYLGGNFWATPTGTGFSQNCTSDADADYICDNPNYGSYDYLPLIYGIVNITCTESWGCSGWGTCNSSSVQTRTCTDLNSCGTNISKPAESQSCTPTVTGSGNWCYQESANVSTSCGGLSTGKYTYMGWQFTNLFNIIDGDWNLGGRGLNSSNSNLYINYSRPTNASSSSLWQIKDANGIRNVSIYSSCWSYGSQLAFRVKATNSSVNWTCQYGTAYDQLYQLAYTSGNGTVYEEAMIWNITSATSSSTTSNTTSGTGTSGGSSGGGGSSGVSGTEGIGTNITQNITTITPTQPAVIQVNDSQIYLTKITLNVLESVQSVSVTITKVNVLENATLKLGLPSGQFYQAFKVDTAGVTSSNIANVTIEFKVNKVWLAGKNGTISGIELYRRQDTSSQWNSLTTSFAREDSEFYYFTSVSPGFSTFAVFFKSCQGAECTNTLSKSIIIYIIIALVGIAILVISFLLLKKIRKNKK